MSESIDQFCENLRVRLTTMDKSLQALTATIDAKARDAEQDVRTHLAAVRAGYRAGSVERRCSPT